MMPELHDAKTCPTCVRMRERAVTVTVSGVAVAAACVVFAAAVFALAVGAWTIVGWAR